MNDSFDSNEGLIKVSWQHVRDKVAQVEPIFSKIVDEIDPDPAIPATLINIAS